MTNDYKQKEAQHYDRLLGKNYAHILNAEDADVKMVDKRYVTAEMMLGKLIRMPYIQLEQFLASVCPGKKVLDYGCGHGAVSAPMAKMGAHITGIDISHVAIELAKRHSKSYGIDTLTEYYVMDGESLEFADESFDIVFNAGTLSYVDKNKAMKEIARVLKKSGYFIGVDSLAGNPFVNLWRWIKVKKNRMTEQSRNNMLRQEQLAMFNKYFSHVDIHYHHLITTMFLPLRHVKWLSEFAESYVYAQDERLLAKYPKLGKYAYKFTFCCRK